MEYDTMSADLVEKARQLNKELLESETYRRYIESKKKLNENEEYKQNVTQFKNTQCGVELKKINGEEVPEGEEFSLLEWYSDINMIPECGAFLRDETALLQLIKKLCDTLIENVEVDMEMRTQ